MFRNQSASVSSSISDPLLGDLGSETPKDDTLAAITEENSSSNKDNDNKEEDREDKPKKPGHGRLGHEAYINAKIVNYPHPTLKAKDACPIEGCTGKLYELKPSVFVSLSGNPLVSVIKHVADRLRCSSCLSIFSACHCAGLRKCDEALVTSLAIQKYGAGMPFYRQEALQKMQDIPLPASSQYKFIVDFLYPPLSAVFNVLKDFAANGSLFHFDDTHVKILEIIKENETKRLQEEGRNLGKKGKRTGMFATGILSYVDEKICVLFLIGKKHSGENLKDILSKRTTKDSFIGMSDAHAVNTIISVTSSPDKDLGIWGRCLAHARQKFYDLLEDFKEECTRILFFIHLVYQNDEHTTKEKMSFAQRLTYHQQKSLPLMLMLKKYLDQLIEEKKVEPNSNLGRAINYTLKNWSGLTQFLKVKGAPLDNNIIERILKLFILNRKNAYFYKTERGAEVASCIMSMIATCKENGINPFYYFIALQKYEKFVLKNPFKWLPWNYEKTLEETLRLLDPIKCTSMPEALAA